MSDSPSQPKPTTPPGWEISPQEVAALLKNGEDFLFVDCRTEDEHEAACIGGAQLMPLQDLDLHLPTLQQHKQKLIVIHCKGGKRSLNLTAVLRQQGFQNVKSMSGGIERWSKEIDPSVPMT